MATGYYLLDHSNPHRTPRADGRRFNGQAPPRRSQIRVVAIHTAENAMDDVSIDTGAENVAAYLSRTERQASYHELYDSDSVVLCLPWACTAWGIRSFNSPTVQVSFACRTTDWDDNPEWTEAAIRNGARRVRQIADHFDIPLRWLSREQALDGQKGFVRHATMDPARRSDPGALFPADRFFELIELQDKEDEMTPEDIEKIVDAVWERKVRDAVNDSEITAQQALEVAFRDSNYAVQIAREVRAGVEELKKGNE